MSGSDSDCDEYFFSKVPEDGGTVSGIVYALTDTKAQWYYAIHYTTPTDPSRRQKLTINTPTTTTTTTTKAAVPIAGAAEQRFLVRILQQLSPPPQHIHTQQQNCKMCLYVVSSYTTEFKYLWYK